MPGNPVSEGVKKPSDESRMPGNPVSESGKKPSDESRMPGNRVSESGKRPNDEVRMPGDRAENSTLGVAFWLLVCFGLAVVGVTAATTTGKDWIINASIWPGSELVDDWCDLGMMSNSWCSDYDAFEGMQTTAMVLAGIAMGLLASSICIARPQTVEALSGTLFLLHAIAQASAIGILTILKNTFDDEVELPDFFDRYDTSLDDDLEYDTTFWVAMGAMAGGLIEGISLCLLARSKG